jgi:hypothetical protein
MGIRSGKKFKTSKDNLGTDMQVASGSLGSDSELEKSEYEPLNKVVGPCNGDLPDDGKNKEPVL